jgi:hypothetical protein
MRQTGQKHKREQHEQRTTEGAPIHAVPHCTVHTTRLHFVQALLVPGPWHDTFQALLLWRSTPGLWTLRRRRCRCASGPSMHARPRLAAQHKSQRPQLDTQREREREVEGERELDAHQAQRTETNTLSKVKTCRTQHVLDATLGRQGWGLEPVQERISSGHEGWRQVAQCLGRHLIPRFAGRCVRRRLKLMLALVANRYLGPRKGLQRSCAECL